MKYWEVSLAAALVLTTVAADEKLEFTSIVFRHGARSPERSYPNNRYQEDDWPQGFGQLTIEGMREEYRLGKLFRERYLESGFMNTSYNRSQIYVRSTDYDRTLMSAECVLAGMYPPNEDEEFEPGLHWQPVPVHSVIGDDFLLRGYAADCPYYELLTDETTKSTGYQEIWDENQALFDELTNYTGEPINLTNIWYLYDTLFQESYANYTPPDWYTPEVKDKLQELGDYALVLLSDTSQKRKITGGVWANTVLNNMENKASPKSNLTQKMILYSAHDATLLAMLQVFGLFDGQRSVFASAFVIELYSNDSDYFVRFYYRNETNSDNFFELTHPDCAKDCPLNQLQQILKSYRLTVEEVKELCTISSAPASNNHIAIGLGVGLGVATVVLMFVLLGLMSLCIYRKRKNRRRQGYKSLTP